MMCRSQAGKVLGAVVVLSCWQWQAYAQDKKPIVAVFDIEDKGARLPKQLRIRLSDYLAMKLAATGKYQVVPRDQIKKRLVKQKRKSYRACFKQTCQIEIGKELAAQKSLSTAVIKLGSKCTVTTVLYDLRRATSEGGASAKGGCKEDEIVVSLETMVRKLIGHRKSTPGAPVRKRPIKRTKLVGKGGLLVKTNPSGAVVMIDGVVVSGKTPLTARNLDAGEHEIYVRRGLYSGRKKVVVSANRFVRVSLVLSKVKCQVEVLSTPPEAQVVLDGRAVGKTPTVITHVDAGIHVVELRKTGYLPHRRTIQLGPDSKRNSVDVTLTQAGFIVARSEPHGATLYIDGQYRGKTPARLSVKPGNRSVSYRLKGYETKSLEVMVEKGKETQAPVKLDFTEAERSRRLEEENRRRQAMLLRQRAEASRRSSLGVHQRSDAPTSRTRRSKTIGAWTTLGLGAAVAIGAVVMYGLGVSQGSDAHDQYMDTTDWDQIYDQRQEIDAARTKLVVGHVLAGSAIGLLGCSVYMFITRPALSESPAAVHQTSGVDLLPVSGGGILSLTGRF